jgi:superfamily II DNA or RNA helicase
MNLELHNVRAKVTLATDTELSWLNNYLTYDDKSYAARKRGGDGKVRLLNAFDRSFPAGFFKSVLAAAPTPGFTVTVDDQRKRPCAPDWSIDLSWLRPYQLDAVNKALIAENGLLQMPTGSGKTGVCTTLMRLLSCKWLFVVPQADLLWQTAEQFAQQSTEEIGTIGDGAWNEKRVTVATFQALTAALEGRSSSDKQLAAVDLLGKVEGVIADECHTVSCESILSVLGRTRNAFYRFGVSGTPLARTDRRSILTIGALGGVIHRIKPETLIQAGYLSKPTIKLAPCVQDSAAVTWKGVYSELVVRSKQRNQSVVNMTVAAQKPAFVFVQHVKHGKLLRHMLESAGLRVDFVWGVHETWLRQKVLERLETCKLDAVVCSAVFQQAIDVPELRSVINAAAGASVIAAIQRIGRGTRVTATKNTFEVWDVADRGNRWLEKHTRARVNAYTGEGYQVSTCPEHSAPNKDGKFADPNTVSAEAEYRRVKKEERDALRALTGENSIRKRTGTSTDNGRIA